jgi:hypothetical protein
VSNGALRVALLHPCYSPEIGRLGTELAARGHEVTVVTSHAGLPSRRDENGVRVVRHWRPPAAGLEQRGLQAHLTHMPFAAASLRAGRFDLAHAFFLTDAAVAARWSARTGRPAVFSCAATPERRTLASKRRRLALVREAIRGAAAVVVATPAAADACRRWLGVDAAVIDPGDASRHEELYRRLLR